MSIFQDGVPALSAELIERLNQEVPRAVVANVTDLAAEESRLELARLAGQRELVDRLVLTLKREQEDA